MAYEYEREPQRDADSAAREEFVAGLRMMSADFDRMVENFGWCAAQIAGDPDAPARIRGMIEFAMLYHEFGMDRAAQSIQETSGVKTVITIPRVGEIDVEKERPGIVVGLTGARKTDSDRRSFEGIAVMGNSRGQTAFVDVLISPDGRTILNPNQKRTDPETRRLMRELYPKRK